MPVSVKAADSANSSGPGDKGLLVLLVAVSLVFALILWPFYGVILWAVVLAIVFAPLNRRLLKLMHERRALAAITAVTIIVVLVILPLTLIVAALVEEASGVYKRIESGELNPGQSFRRAFEALPAWAANLAQRFGVTDLGSLQERLSASLAKGSQFMVRQAVNIGQDTLNFVLKLFVTLYLLFFLFRDGDKLSRQLRDAIPLRAEQKRALLDKFTTVIRATVKGNILVALMQGGLGGLIFWILRINAPLLWAVVMAILSLLPAIGAGLVWFPVAIYLLVTGSVARGVVLLAYGVFVISLVDNFLRPILVGKDTRMPDYVVLISTLGGLAVFGINGFVLGPVIAAMFIAAWHIFSSRSQFRTSNP